MEVYQLSEDGNSSSLELLLLVESWFLQIWLLGFNHWLEKEELTIAGFLGKADGSPGMSRKIEVVGETYARTTEGQRVRVLCTQSMLKVSLCSRATIESIKVLSHEGKRMFYEL